MKKDRKIHLDFVIDKLTKNMGYIKEPKGVDLVINSRPITKEEGLEISEYIRAYKAKHAQKKGPAKRTKSTKTSQGNLIANSI